MPQLPLPLSLPNNKSFENFYVGENDLLINTLLSILKKNHFFCFYIWSSTVAGKTHLLHAASNNKSTCYIPLKEYFRLSPDILYGLENYDIVCLDDIDIIANNKQWEESIFDLFNKLLEKNKSTLLITANAPPKKINFILPDLVSRLSWGFVYHLKELNDEEKIKMLQLVAKLKGFELPSEVGFFILKRVNRDIKTLFLLFEKLEKASLIEQRKLTIPFTKYILDL